MQVMPEILNILDEVLSLGGRSKQFTRDTPLLGAVPELDSMAVVSLIGGLEERFGIAVDDVLLSPVAPTVVPAIEPARPAITVGAEHKSFAGVAAPVAVSVNAPVVEPNGPTKTK